MSVSSEVIRAEAKTFCEYATKNKHFHVTFAVDDGKYFCAPKGSNHPNYNIHIKTLVCREDSLSQLVVLLTIFLETLMPIPSSGSFIVFSKSLHQSLVL